MHSSTHSIGKSPLHNRSAGGAPPTSNLPVAETARLASLRRSTPDSEAILSSDDEHELTRSVQSLTGKPARQSTMVSESSWLSEIQSGPPRRPSATTTTSNISQPQTPLEQHQDSNGWPFQNALSRVSSHPVTASWNSGNPWSAQPRMQGEDRHPPASAREPSAPYSIPLQPVPKTYRSQSYSVGQMESELSAAAGQGSSLDHQRRTPSQQLPHRPSRPSMLSEVFEGHDPNRAQGYESGMYAPRSATSPMSPDGRRDNVVESSHNPLLRHATKARARHGQSASTSDTRSPTGFHPAYHHSSVLPASEEVIDEEPEHFGTAGLTRRFSELTGLGVPGEGARRGQWHTSLGFGALPDIPQSRRHSMAEMPTRRNSLVGALDPAGPFSPIDNQDSLAMGEDPFQNALAQTNDRDMQNRNYAQSYFSGIGPALRSRIESSQSPVSSGMHNLPYQASPPQGIFSRPGQDTLLYLVSFKCARAEVYYVADNTGLSVKAGDLVIVEADRGHDLGTVLYAKISWAQAREAKQRANDEHYRWLMMFSRHNQASEGTTAGGTGGMMAGSAPDRSPNNIPSGTAVFNPSMIDAKNRETELKPKMIKRLAQPHEIATLRDKEGNEAKAKRICSQKVNEMKLDMEILDAEFQTDWKKLTFFYYANSYVNFNVLVTDLFKIYKTRIWMSAVNPASLNTGPLPPPRGLGPGAISGRDSALGHRSASSRSGYSGMNYGGDQYASGNPYQGMNSGGSYGYGEEHGSAGNSQSHTPAQQVYDFMATYNSSQPQMGGQNYGNMQSYGWGGYNAGYAGYQPSHMGFGSGPGMPHTRGTPHEQSGGYGMPTRGAMSPISPPGTQVPRGQQ
ncbi:PSP1-like protein [Elsinoe fawcettii]|nr:PSP1-like protein [Elsinoe fawcettii]